MDVVVFAGDLAMGDSKGATMVFAQDFRVEQCAMQERKLTIECIGVEILGPKEHREISSHAVYLDDLLVGRIDSDQAEFSLLPVVNAGLHRVSIHVSTFPEFGVRDDFTLRRVVFSYR